MKAMEKEKACSRETLKQIVGADPRQVRLAKFLGIRTPQSSFQCRQPPSARLRP